MSNVVVKRLYGCDASQVEGVQDAMFARDERVIGWHSRYDQAEDFYWWGATDDSGWGDRGFNEWPADFSAELKVSVDEAWAALDEETRNVLGPPKLLLLVAYD